MTLGQYVRQYREEHNLSQRKFAELCGLSNAYISILEDGKSPKTGKDLIPKLDSLLRIANAMNITLDDLFDVIDDMEVDISTVSKAQKLAAPKIQLVTVDINEGKINTALSQKEMQMLELFRLLTEEEQEHVLQTAKMIAKQ